MRPKLRYPHGPQCGPVCQTAIGHGGRHVRVDDDGSILTWWNDTDPTCAGCNTRRCAGGSCACDSATGRTAYTRGPYPADYVDPQASLTVADRLRRIRQSRSTQ